MRSLMASEKQMARTTENILIVGETGTGKEVVACLIRLRKSLIQKLLGNDTTIVAPNVAPEALLPPE